MVRHRHSRHLFVAPDVVSPQFTYFHDSSFDNNMVIILSALLCALIFILGLNSLIRCAIGYARRNTLGGQDLSTSECAQKGLKIEAVSKIPVVVFVSGIETCEVECPICLGEFDEGESIRILPMCNHGFHVMCIDKWLVSRSSCPMCRQLLFEQIA